MKTTIDLDDALLQRAKAHAVRQRTTLTRLVEDGLRLRLRAAKAPAVAIELPVFHGRGGLVAGVDGRSNRAMLEAAGEN